jgi:hypothetical protein
MSLGDRVRIWLGLDDVPSLQDMDALKASLSGARAEDARRHTECIAAINKLITTLNAAHVLDRPIDYNSSTLSWEAVEAIAMQNLNQPVPNEFKNTWE